MFGILQKNGISNNPIWVSEAGVIPPPFTTIVAGLLFNDKSCDNWSYALWMKVEATIKIGLAFALPIPEIKLTASC